MSAFCAVGNSVPVPVAEVAGLGGRRRVGGSRSPGSDGVRGLDGEEVWRWTMTGTVLGCDEGGGGGKIVNEVGRRSAERSSSSV